MEHPQPFISPAKAPSVPGLDEKQVRSFLKPHVHLSGPGGSVFVSGEGVRSWARAMGLAVRPAMCALLEFNIWPERFRRNCGVFSSQAMIRLLRSRALVLGCGGLGGHVASLLARLGLGGVRLCDSDVFEESNLNRQYFCTEKTLGRNKAEVTGEGVLEIASYMDVNVVSEAANSNNMPELVRSMDVVMDCLDHIPLKKRLEEAALTAGTPFVHGSVLREEGFAFLELPGDSPMLKGLYPQDPDETELAAGRREGVIATAPAGVACLMCSLAVRRITGQANMSSALLHLDYSVPEMESFRL